MIDASKAFDVASSPNNRSSRKPTFTESAGRSAFEDALSKSRADDEHWEAGLSATSVAPSSQAPEVGEIAIASERATSRSSGPDTRAAQDVRGPSSVSSGPEEAGNPVEEEPVAEDARQAASEDGDVDNANDAVNVEDAQSSEAGGSEVGDGEFALEGAQWDEADTTADSTEHSDGGTGEAEEVSADLSGETSETFGDEPDTEMSNANAELDADVQFEVAAVQSVDVNASPAAASTSGTTQAAPAPTFVENFGRQAFTRSTEMHKAATAPPASLDMDDLVDQIAKVRGSMSTGRARVVVGEGSDRLALTVLLRNGTVNIDARAADANMAESLAKGSAELSEALEKHGLSLGTMDTGGTGGDSAEDAQRSEAAQLHGATEVAGEAAKAAKGPIARRGVRIVA